MPAPLMAMNRPATNLFTACCVAADAYLEMSAQRPGTWRQGQWVRSEALRRHQWCQHNGLTAMNRLTTYLSRLLTRLRRRISKCLLSARLLEGLGGGLADQRGLVSYLLSMALATAEAREPRHRFGNLHKGSRGHGAATTSGTGTSFLANVSSSSARSTNTVAPSPNSPAIRRFESGFSRWCWMARLSGRAPN